MFGHVLLTTEGLYSDRIIKAAISWIWFFHMPAFAIVSGYFSNPMKPTKSILVSSGKLLVTYVIMQLVLSVIYGPRDIKTVLLIPQYALWYLLALPVWRLVAHVLKQWIITNTKLLVLAGVVICLVAGFIPISVLGFQRICSFFCLGMLLKEDETIEKLRGKYQVAGIIILFFLFVVFLIPNRTICSGMCNVPYNGIFQFFTRSSVLVLGSIMSLAFFSAIPESKILADIGKNTLFIYCFHVFFILQIIPHFWIRMNIQPNIFIIIAYTLAVFVSLYFLSKIKLLNKVIKPF